MGGNLNISMLPFFRYQHLKYYLNNTLGEYSEREYFYKLECLNEWWAVEQYVTDSSVNTMTSINCYHYLMKHDNHLTRR